MSDLSPFSDAVRRFEETAERITRQLADIVAEIREERRRNEETYVRRDVAQAERRADQAKVRELEKDVAALDTARQGDAGFRRQVLLWGAGVTITTVVSAAIAVANIVSR